MPITYCPSAFCCGVLRLATSGESSLAASGSAAVAAYKNLALVERALGSRQFGPYTLQAAIAALISGPVV